MRTIIVIIAVAVGVPQSARGDDTGRPLAIGIARGATRLAREQPQQPPTGWGKLRALAPGRTIVVSTASSTLPGVFVAVDNERLTFFTNGALSSERRRQLTTLASEYGDALVAAARGRQVGVGRFDFRDGAVWDRGEYVARLSDVVVNAAASEVVVVTTGPVRRGSAVAAASGALGGSLLGLFTAFAARDAMTAWAALIGIPIGSSAAAYAATSHVTEEVLYQRAPLRH